jgi:hypothetical protein
MAMRQSTFGGFVIGFAVGVAAMYYGPDYIRKHVTKEAYKPAPPGAVRVEVPPDHTPGLWRRKAKLAIEFSQKKADGNPWDWPLTAPELSVCIREGTEYRKCLTPADPAVKSCQGVFTCVTGTIDVPDVPFTVELFEFDDYNAPDPIGAIDCDIGRTCEFPLGRVRVMEAKGG